MRAPAYQIYLLAQRAARVATKIVRTCLAIERFRITESRLPYGLSELVPRFMAVVPMDDLDSDRPLLYRHGNGGYELSSVGNDDSNVDLTLSIIR